MKIRFLNYEKNALFGYFMAGRTYSLPDGVAQIYLNNHSAKLISEDDPDLKVELKKALDNRISELENKKKIKENLIKVNLKHEDEKNEQIEASNKKIDEQINILKELNGEEVTEQNEEAKNEITKINKKQRGRRRRLN